MGSKLCPGSSDTPFVTLDCTFVSVNRSPNVNLDLTDGKEEDVGKISKPIRCCCFLWHRRRQENENIPTKMKI